jgi:signal transduction histidine kinase/HAMP domain-containing protein
MTNTTAPDAPRPRRRLFWKYVVVIVALVTMVPVTRAGVDLWFTYRENQAALVALQREKAGAAATRIEAFIREIERQMGWTTQPLLVSGPAALEQRRIDFLRLLRQVPAITELSYLDKEGKEQLRVSRLAMDVTGSANDLSADERFTQAIAGRVYHGPVYFRRESEPYMVLAMAQSGGGVTVAEVNLKFIWDVVTQIKIGKAGRAYVADESGNLIAHPDISLVLQKTSLATLPQVREAISGQGDGSPLASDVQGRRVLTAHVTIPGLRWVVFAEQPLGEALEPLRASIKRSLVLLVVGIALAMAASLALARRMVRPIQALQVGAARIGGGELGHRLEIHSGDELETLADEFNRMTAHLQESYATLEQRVEDRTRELSESLEQQTATSEILRVISSSPGDLTPVFESIAQSAARLCDAAFGGVIRVEDGLLIPAAASYEDEGQLEFLRKSFPLPVERGGAIGVAIAERRVAHVHDFLVEHGEDDDYLFTAGQPIFGYRTILVVPMLRDEAAIGGIVLWRTEPRPFTDKQIEFVRTFADQAVIAIENVRLFTELEAKNAAVTEALEQQTATSEILRVISGATLDAQPVFEAIVQNAATLCDGFLCVVYRLEDDRVHVVAHNNFTPEMQAVLGRVFPAPIDAEIAAVRSIREARTIQIDDVLASAAPAISREIGTAVGFRTLLTVPMLRDGVALGSIAVGRVERRPFSPKQIALLQTFADQAVIAIENVRLFTELQERTSQLQVASRHKDEFLANMSHELRTPLNAIIGFSEVMIERMFGEINEKQEEYLNDILSSGRHLLSLINDILDLSKIEAGKMELDLADFNLGAAIDNALTLVHERAARRGLTLAQDVDERIGDFRGDERKVKQVLLNLLSNAIKFTPEGGRIDVRAVPKGDVIEISVTDTGVGIAPEDREAVFEEFRQVGTDVAKKHEGTGLGLALTQRFVELHGGNIWLESEVGVGSTFTFALPVRR